MNEESDCYYSKNLLPVPGGSLSCRVSAQDYFSSNKRTLAELNADIWFKYLKACSSNQSSKRITPPVPKFEETQKKVKLNMEIPQSNTDSLSPVSNDVNTHGLENHTISTNNMNLVHKVKVIKVIPETQSYDELFKSGSKKSKANVKFQEKLQASTKQVEELHNSPNRIEEEVKSGNHSPNTASQLPEKPITIALSPEPLDKKDEKKFQKFLECLNLYTERLNISNPDVTEKFKELARIAIPKLVSHFKSKPFEAVAAAIMLYACRETDYPITLKQIVHASDSKEKLINKCVFSLKEILPNDTEVKHFKAGEFIKVLIEKLNLNDKMKAAAIKIWENIERLNFIKSIHAVTLASCCLKFACALSENDRDFDAIADAASITKMTLKNMYRELFPYRFYFITADCMLRDPKELKKL